MKEKVKKIREEAEVIKQVLQAFKQGASLEEIMAASGLGIELRTFQRRLARLKESGEVVISGDTRATRYHLAVKDNAIGVLYEPESAYGKSRYEIPLSPASRKIIATLSLPEAQRTPVGYQRGFLEGYKPDTDSFLSQSEKEKLAKMGNTARLHEPAGTYAREILNRLLIDLSWNSSRLEGNTYSLLDTERLISMGAIADSKTTLEAQMILNHKDAIEFMVEGAEEMGFNR
nr:hypothetical protein [Chitinophagaceae bacterium]